MDNEKLKCPCMPQCPNYGKCRECIAAHAEFYTVPHCIKRMQEDMKKNHRHPSNPHIKKTLPERIEEFYEKNPNVHLCTVAEALKITEWQLLDAIPTAVSIPVDDFGKIYDKLKELNKVKLHLDAGGVLIQLTTPLPEMAEHQGTKIISRKSGDMSLTSLIFEKSLYAIFLVREVLCGGKESLSVALINEEEKTALSIYLCRSDESTIEPKAKELFEELWTKYRK